MATAGSSTRGGDDGSWRYRRLDAGATLTLRDDASISVDAIYEGAFELPGD
ncbi:MAG: hypothetical protein U0326_26810 [Polyangiales bacterium]